MAGKKAKSTKRKTTTRAKSSTTKRAAKKTTTAKKAKGRTTATKRATTRSTASKKAKTTTVTTKKLPAIKEPMTNTGMIKTITDVTAVSKKDVVATLECLYDIIEKHLKGPGKFVLGSRIKIDVIKKKARPARDGINPFTGEKIRIKAKPASKAVRIKPLKKLKEVVA